MGVPECATDDYFNFKIKGPNGDELFTGPNPTHNVNELELITLNNGVSKEIAVSYNSDRLVCLLDHECEFIVIKVSGQARDTVNFSLEVTDGKCCGKETRIEKVYDDGQETNYEYYNPVEIVIN